MQVIEIPESSGLIEIIIEVGLLRMIHYLNYIFVVGIIYIVNGKNN